MPDPTRRVSISGTDGQVSVRIPSFPVRRDDHGRLRFVYPDFGAEFFPTLWDEIPLAERVGPPWRRRDECFSCQHPLTGVTRPEKIQIDIALRAAAPFEVELELPMVRCGACGTLQAFERGRSLEAELSEALVRAFDTAQVEP